MILATRNRVEHPIVLEETIYTMPNWIVKDIAFRRKHSKSQISKMHQALEKKHLESKKVIRKLQPLFGETVISLKGKVLPKIKPIDAQSEKPLSNPKLKRISLEKKTKARWRRELTVAVAKINLLTAESQNLSDESNISNFLKIVEDPVAAEAEALEIWNRFVDECEVPSSFLVPTRSPLSLYELMVIRSGNETRQKFVNQNPWVARTVLKSKKRDKQFRKIDANLENAIKVACEYTCCMNQTVCHPARKLATKLAHNQSPEIGQLDDVLAHL